MIIKQISVFVENTPGKLADITDTLYKNGIDIRALSIADTSDYGVLRLIVDKIDTAYDVLKESGVVVLKNDVLAVNLPDVPGGFAKAVRTLSDAGIEIEYSYAFLTRTVGSACVIFRVENNEAASDTLSKAGFEVAQADMF